MQNAQQLQYLKTQVETASPGELTLLLYQEIVKTLHKAKMLHGQGQYEGMSVALHKVRSIFNELIITLDMKYSISQNLKDLYLFYNQQIAQAIMTKDEKFIDHTLDFSKEMVNTWKQALTLVKTGRGGSVG